MLFALPLLQLVLLFGTFKFFLQTVLPFCENRPDEELVTLDDPILRVLPLVNCTQFINKSTHVVYMMYAFNVVYLIGAYCTGDYREASVTMTAFTLLFAVRTVFLYITPFNLPKNHIHLEDQVQNVVATRHENFDKDLLFSGHVSGLMLFGLTFYCFPLISIVFYLLATLQAAAMLLSRIHYTVDIVTAPFVTFTCFELSKMLTYFLYSQ
jgi:hypothetical protein